MILSSSEGMLSPPLPSPALSLSLPPASAETCRAKNNPEKQIKLESNKSRENDGKR